MPSATTRRATSIFFLLTLVLLQPRGAVAQGTGAPVESVRYTVRFTAPETQYAEVDATFPAQGRTDMDVMMPVWTPGSYLVREYARNVEAVTAQSGDGRALTVARTTKNHWRIQSGGAPFVRFHYRVYAHEMGVRTNWIEARWALLNGAATFITPTDAMKHPYEVSLVLPPAWTTSVSGLRSGSQPHSFLADDYDTLVDSPIVAGDDIVAVHQFTAGNKPHFLVNVGEAGLWDVQRSVEDVGRIVEADLRLWGELPYDKYVFFNILSESGGGLEHKNSTVIMSTRWATRTHRRYIGWLGTISHEYFHLWNVKRLRPIELGPFNYDQENYTRSLWISEGLTDYYGELMLARAGLVSRDEFLGQMSSAIEQLQTTPGRLVLPLEQASFDAWIKEYRPDENSPNTSISYYTKGGVVGFVLDAKVRRATAGTKSLDDVMRLAYKRFSGERGFTPADFRRVVNEVAGSDLSDWMHRALDTTEELDYQDALDWFGLRFKSAPGSTRDRGTFAWQGLRLRPEPGGRLIVAQVRRDTPAYGSGIIVDDEVLALNDFRVRQDQWESRVDTFKPGDVVSVLVARRDELMRFDIKVEKPRSNDWNVSVKPDATPDQERRLNAWLWAS